MAARFYEGPSVKATRNVVPQYKDHSRAPDGNTMKGMRGFVRTGQDQSAGGLVSKGERARFAPGESTKTTKATRQFGTMPSEISPGKGTRRGNWQGADRARGSMDKDYSQTSEGRARGYSKTNIRPKGESSHGGSEKEGTGRPSPMGGRKDSIRTQWNWPAGAGQVSGRGKMESLRGKAVTSYERKGR